MPIPDVATREIAAAPAQPERPLIRISDVSKTYQNGTVALSDVDLDVAHGEFVSLIGPSGCGKSTLLRLIAGLGQVSSGTIEWPLSRRDARGEPIRDLGFVFQDPTLMPWATVADNVYLPLKLSGVGRRAAKPRIEQALANGQARELCRGLSARVVGRHENARRHCPRPGRRAEGAADGRALFGARRDYPLPPQQRSAAALARAALDGGLCHPQRIRVGLSLEPHRCDEQPA